MRHIKGRQVHAGTEHLSPTGQHDGLEAGLLAQLFRHHREFGNESVVQGVQLCRPLQVDNGDVGRGTLDGEWRCAHGLSGLRPCVGGASPRAC